MLRQPSGVVPARPAAMEVESTRVQTLPDGKKMIDVTMRRAQPMADSEKLVLPQFDDEDDSSSSDDEEDTRHHLPQYQSPMKKPLPGDTDPDNDDENNNATDLRKSAAETSFRGDFQWSGVQDIQSLTHTNAALHEQVSGLKTQVKTLVSRFIPTALETWSSKHADSSIDRLQIQLEALAPVPGLNVSAVQDILLDKDGTEHDIRDTKIVHQAKTLRHLKRSLQREKQLAVDAVRQCKSFEAHAAALEKENETLKLKLARFQARASATAVPVVPAADDPQSAGENSAVASSKDKHESVTAYKKKFEDMRIKHDKLLSDLKKTQRALAREVGDDVPLDELVDGSSAGSENARRGRAQQIIMLKAKVKKLEQELSKASMENGTSGPSSDVDQRAMQDLSAQQAQKQRVIDKLTMERDELMERTHQLTKITKKFDALKSRTQILEKEKQDHKAKLQVLVDKSRNDDALVDALQKQLETWKGKLQEAKRARTAESLSVASGGGSGALPKDERMELDRLRAMVADYRRQQASGQNNTTTLTSNGFMPPPSEAAQYRSITAEKERLVEHVKMLQSQLEDKEKQIRTLRSPVDPPSISQPTSRIPRLGSGSLPNSQYVPTPPPAAATDALETQKKQFRDAMVSKEQEIETLKLQLQRLTQHHEAGANAQQEIQDLQEENDYLRQEFDRLKTRYEAVLKNARKPAS